jgi:hypothetical protein
VSDSGASTRNPSAGDDRADRVHWLETLKRLVLQVTPFARNQFARELSHELTRAALGGCGETYQSTVALSKRRVRLGMWTLSNCPRDRFRMNRIDMTFTSGQANRLAENSTITSRFAAAFRFARI